jgi:inosine-uridine nucleoside N-ribohydrolase
MRERMRAILDCDPGNGIPGSDVDDGLAFGYLSSVEDVDLLGVTVVAGNTAVEDGYDVARSMVAASGRDVPVVAGNVRALLEDPAPWIRRRKRAGSPIDVEELWRDVPRPRHVPPHLRMMMQLVSSLRRPHGILVRYISSRSGP